MKKSIVALIAFSPLILSLISATSDRAARKYISIQQAYDAGAIKLKITGTGGYSGNCLEMEISNTLRDSGFYRLEAGRRLASDDSTLQDILVTKELHIPLAAGEKKHFSLFGFCCQLHHHAPAPKSTYSVGKMAKYDLVALAQFLNEKSYSTSAMQYAVWVISDNNPLSSVIADNMDSISSLREMVGKIKHIEVPWYSLEYLPDNSQLFSGEHCVLTGTLKYAINTNAIVNISVYDSYGQLVKTICDAPANPDTYVLPLRLDVRGWQKGKYYVRATRDDIKIFEKTFEL